MTTPAEPATGAGASGTDAQSPEPTVPTDQQPATGSDAGADWTTTFEGLTPEEVKEKLDHARTWEKRAKANKAALDEAKAATAGPKDGEPTLADLQAQAASEREAREAAETRAVELAYDNAVSRVAPKVGADADALLDSDRFRREVGEELGDDFDDDDLRAAVKKIAAKFAKDPRFAGGKTSARSGADITGGPGAPRQITEDELSRMSPEQIVKAQDEGLLRNLLGG